MAFQQIAYPTGPETRQTIRQISDQIRIRDVEAEKLPELGVGIEKSGTYLDQLQQLKEQMETGGGETITDVASAIDLDEVISEAGALRLPIHEARSLVREERWEEALAVLAEVLAEGPNAEASYLTGLCLFHLSRLEDALVALAPILSSPPDELERPLGRLKHQIRAQMMAGVLLENILLVQTGQVERALDRLRRLTGLDPGAGLYHFMLSGNLMSADRLDEALEAADVGLSRCEPDHRKQLEGLRRQIDQRLLETAMAPAREHYRRGKYAKARSALESLDARHRERALWITFHRYLTDLGGGLGGLRRGKRPWQVKPSGRFQDVDKMHFFLVREEIGRAKLHLERGRLDSAVEVLDQALEHAPHFPYAHFLEGVCLYQRTGESLTGDSPPHPDAAIESLGGALEHARQGAADAEINDAPQLVAAIEGAIEAMEGVRAQLRQLEREAEQVNGVVQSFASTMEMVGDGITSPEHFHRIHEAMRGVRSQVKVMAGKVAGPHAQQALAQLGEVVEHHMKQLDELEPRVREAEEINEAGAELASIVEQGNAGTAPRDLLKRLEPLRKRISKIERAAVSEDGKEHGGKLKEAADNLHAQLTAMAEVAPLMKEFESILEAAQGGVSSLDQADSLASRLQALSKKVAAAKRSAKDDHLKEALDQLGSNVARNLEALDASRRKAREVPREVGELNAMVMEFNQLMEGAKGGLESKDAFFEFVKGMADLKTRVDALKTRMPGREGKQAAGQLADAIEGVFKQLSGG